jgi:hypothetical protein
MPLTEQHTRLARLIDTHVREILAHSGSDEAIRMLMADDMGPLAVAGYLHRHGHGRTLRAL